MNENWKNLEFGKQSVLETKSKKQVVLDLLKNIKRPGKLGMDILIDLLEQSDFFKSPASIRYHGAYEGGLVNHSLSVYSLFSKLNRKFKLGLSEDSVIICSILHDICKVGAYIKSGSGYIWNKKHSQYHAIDSLKLIKEYINLTDEEIEIIIYHMGMYGTYEFSNISKSKGEYSLQELTNIYNINKAAKLFHFCDDISTQFLED